MERPSEEAPLSTEIAPMRRSTYDKAPATVMGSEHRAWTGHAAWDEIARAALQRNLAPVVAVDVYPGVDVPALLDQAEAALAGWDIVNVEDAAARPLAEIDRALQPFLTDDRVFGVLARLGLDVFYDEEELRRVGDAARSSGTPTLLVGWGASRAVASDVVVLADLARWEIQARLRAGGTNWRADNADEDILRKYKRGFFVEWRTADEHKRELFDTLDFVLDTNRGLADTSLITGETFRAGLAQTVSGPFRVVPFFDPGVWGGQWMKELFGLDDDAPNYAWCFDCVPEENSLYLTVDGRRVELPSLDVVLQHPRELLGERVFSRFGAEFPIRFDFLDTMEGGNLSLQVHPLTDYIQRTFGMPYTQDESYYLLDAAPHAEVFLGIKTGTDPERMLADLRRANDGEGSFPASEYVNTYPAKKHDHFLIPAGTVHCSGADSMVLEISATPFIFTFKMWDWDRLGLDGKPRPINLAHAERNIVWERDTEWTTENLVNRVTVIAQGDDWVEEQTGLHALEFIETRRHWFTGRTPHDTRGTVNVLNLVEGDEVTVESPTGAFAPFVVHYAETFIVPAAVGPFTIRPSGPSEGTRCATLKAYVRGTETGSDS